MSVSPRSNRSLFLVTFRTNKSGALSCRSGRAGHIALQRLSVRQTDRQTPELKEQRVEYTSKIKASPSTHFTPRNSPIKTHEPTKFSASSSMRLEETTKSSSRGWSGSQYLGSRRSTFGSSWSYSSQQSNDLDDISDLAKLYRLPSDAEMLERARAAHTTIDFDALAAGSEKGGPWQRVETADQFVVFKRPSSAVLKDNRLPGLEVMCAGWVDACLEEVGSVLRSNSEVDHDNTMEGLYSKNFIFGSLDREVSCSGAIVPDNQDDDFNEDTSEQLNVKTSSFLRSTLFGRNEQWCFSDFYQRMEERDGFTIAQCALPPFEPTPGRVVGANARVDQLHGLNASYVVDQLPNQKRLRVVYNAWFEEMTSSDDSTISTDTSISSYSSSWGRSSAVSVSSSSTGKNLEASTASTDMTMSSRSSGSRRRSSNLNVAGLGETADDKAQLRRLLSLAHGLTNLPELVRRRRFGLQVPADLDAIQVVNTRCPCCTHSLAPVKMSLSKAASVFAKRSLRSLKMDTRRCYLCGYLVCIDCWSAECMESTVGRVAEIVVCTRCHASVKACDYSEVYAPDQDISRGPVKVVEDQNNESPAPMLIDFLVASLMNTPASEDRAAVLSVVRMLLQQSESGGDDSDEDYCDDSDSDYDEGFSDEQNDNVPVVELKKYLSDENQLPQLESCVFANAERRGYPIEQSDDPVTMVPPTIIPPHEDVRLQLVNEMGLMLLANQLAPLDPAPDAFEDACDVRDLNLLCQLAVRASGCANTFISIMGTKHLHILTSSNPAFLHATMPREHTVCQHTIMTPQPFMVSHPEADVRFHELGAIKALSTRIYVGFPLMVPMIDNNGNTETEMAVGTLCCVDPKARAELTRSQYATMKRIADTASRLIQIKAQQLLQQQQSAEALLAG